MAAAPRKKKTRPVIEADSKRLRVTLIVETSFGSGRHILDGIAQYARTHGPWFFHHEWRNTDLVYPGWLTDWEGDGVIARVENKRIGDALRELGIPVVDVLGTEESMGFPLVHVDDAAIARQAADHLLDRGFRHYAYSGFEGTNWSARRRDAFVEILGQEGYGCPVLEWNPHRERPWSWEKELQHLTQWMEQLPKPLGMMVCNDLYGSIVLQACRLAQIAVPDEMAVVGVDNDEVFCEFSGPPLSSVRPDDQQVGYEAARLLDRLMQGKAWNGKRILVAPRGVCTRLSTDVVAVDDPAVVAAVRYIREHARTGLTVRDVVQRAAVSRSLLQRRFKKALGRTLHDEILSVRVNHARFLLEESDMSLSQVAEKSGFKHQEYMGAVFKRVLDQTPNTYRKGSRAQG